MWFLKILSQVRCVHLAIMVAIIYEKYTVASRRTRGPIDNIHVGPCLSSATKFPPYVAVAIAHMFAMPGNDRLFIAVYRFKLYCSLQLKSAPHMYV